MQNKKYTWDDLYKRADGAACGEDTLKAKDTAREQVRQFAIAFRLDDPEKEECPEDVVDDYCNAYNICFDENGNIIETTNYDNNYMVCYDNKIGGTISVIYGAYAKREGVTFIMKDVYTKDVTEISGEKLLSSEVIGFYYGQPNINEIKEFAGKLKAEFN